MTMPAQRSRRRFPAPAFVAGAAAFVAAHIVEVLALTAGAVFAMTIVLIARGPGTIFPIAWIVGAVILSAACTAGAFTGTKL
jgi:hypothetical protein